MLSLFHLELIYLLEHGNGSLKYTNKLLKFYALGIHAQILLKKKIKIECVCIYK